jgi:hypothetical protein
MSMPALVAAVAQRCDVDLLLGVTHFVITTRNMISILWRASTNRL